MPLTRKANPLITGFEKLEHGAARALGKLVASAPRALLERVGVELDGNRLSPEIQLVLALRKRMGQVQLSDENVAAARARMRRDARVHSGIPVPVGAVSDLTFRGAAGPLHARHYVPPGANLGRPRPLLVFFHGGGFALGDLDTHDLPCRVLCRELDVHVLSAEYRLAPEHPFPAGVDDARAALRFAQTHAQELGADPARVGVAGDSAGANLATVTALMAVREGQPKPAFELLIYPVVDSTRDWPSMDLFADGYFLTRRDVHWFRKTYFGGFSNLADPRISPLRAEDLSGMPPTIIITAGFDPLRDEGEAYAAALTKAGVPTKLYRASALIHGFIHLGPVSGAAKEALHHIAELTRQVL